MAVAGSADVGRDPSMARGQAPVERRDVLGGLIGVESPDFTVVC
jgi:hypothetical protein